jgi:hypothetical protein
VSHIAHVLWQKWTRSGRRRRVWRLGNSVAAQGPCPLNSPSLGQDGNFSFTFDAPGVRDYRCRQHPSMTGSVTVAD